MARALVAVHWQTVKRAEMGREINRWGGFKRRQTLPLWRLGAERTKQVMVLHPISPSTLEGQITLYK